MKVSVVIPAYNAEKFLQDCLFSVKRQTLKPTQTFVVNDGSTDNTMWLAHRLDAKTVNRIDNKGIGYTRKEGSEFAEGDYVAFLSVDDAYHSLFLELMMREADGKSILFSDYWRCNESLRPLKVVMAPQFKTQKHFQKLVIEWALKQNMFVNFSTIIIPKYVFNKVQFDETLRHGEDLVFLLASIIANIPFKHIDLPLVYYRVHPEAGTNKGWNINQRFQLWNKLFPLLQKLEVEDAIIHNALRNAISLEKRRQRKRLIPTPIKNVIRKMRRFA